MRAFSVLRVDRPQKSLILIIFGVLAEVLARSAESDQPLLLLGDKDYPPITYLQGDTPQGLDVDLAQELSRQIGRPIRVELMNWDAAQKAVLAGQAEGLLGMCISEDRKAFYDFTDLTFTREFGFFVRTSALPLHGIGDLVGRKVAVTAGGLPRSVLTSAQPGLNLVLVENYQDGFRKLAAGTIDVVAADLWVGAYTVQKARLERITVSGEPFARASAAIALKKGNAALLGQINRALQELNHSGALASIQNKWHPQEILFFSRDRIHSMLVIGSLVSLGLLSCGMGFWVFTLRRQIRIRRTVENALRESEERYKAIAESAPHGITVSIQDQLAYVNPAAARIMAASDAGQLVGRSFYDFVCKEFHDQVRQRRKQMLETGIPAPVMTGKARRLDGEVIEIEGAGTPVLYGGKQAIQNTFIDVTHRRRTELALEQQLAFEALINELLAGFTQATASELDEQIQISLGAIGRFTEADYAFVDQIAPNGQTWSCTHEWCNKGMPSKQSRYQNVPLGTSPWMEKQLTMGQAVQIDRLDDFPAEASQERASHSAEGIRSSLHVPLSGRGGLVNGCVGLLSVSRESVWGDDDTRWLKVLSDTIANALERKRVEEALRQSETRYRTLFESAQDAIFLMEDGRFKDCNLGTLQLFGCSREEILERTPEDFSPPSQPDGQDSKQQAKLRIAEAADGETQRFEWRHRRSDGSEFDAEVSLNQLTLGRREMLLAIVRDISKRKQAEEALRRQAAFDEIIGALLGRLASSSGADIDEQVRSILKEIGLFIGVDLAFVLHIDSEHETWSCTHEWCAPGVQGQRARYQDVVIEPGSWCIRQVWAGKLVNVHSLSELPPDASLTRQRWEAAGYKAVIEVPLRTKGGQVYGCVGLLSFSKEGPWADPDIRRLQMVGDAIANGLERKAAKQRLEASRQQLRALSSRLQSLREEERTRISREIHDHLGQLLTALKLDLRSLDRKIVENVGANDRPALSHKVASARDLADEMIRSVQKIASELRPGLLDRLGLAAAIEAEGQAFQARTGIQCHWNVTEKPLETSQDQSIGIFRIFQELLTNVARHAQATEVEVRLSQSPGELSLEVCDNGVGIRKRDLENPQSLGLLGMEERATMLGGHLRFDSSNCKGTRVTVQIPLQEIKRA